MHFTERPPYFCMLCHWKAFWHNLSPKDPYIREMLFFFSSPGRVQPHMGEDKTHCVVRMGQSKLTHENEDWCNIYTDYNKIINNLSCAHRTLLVWSPIVEVLGSIHQDKTRYKCASKNLDAGVITSDGKPSRRPWKRRGSGSQLGSLEGRSIPWWCVGRTNYYMQWCLCVAPRILKSGLW